MDLICHNEINEQVGGSLLIVSTCADENSHPTANALPLIKCGRLVRSGKELFGGAYLISSLTSQNERIGSIIDGGGGRHGGNGPDIFRSVRCV